MSDNSEYTALHRKISLTVSKLNDLSSFPTDFGYSTGYPGFAGQPANQGNNANYSQTQWNPQGNNYGNAPGAYSQPPPSGPQGIIPYLLRLSDPSLST